MSEAKHTPGPWRASLWKERQGDTPCVMAHGTPIAILHNCMITTDEERKANARLIAAAPELLEALEKITHEEPLGTTKQVPEVTLWRTIDSIKQIARTAIAKATKI